MTRKIIMEIPDGLLEDFDKAVKEKKEYISRSEAIRAFMKKYVNGSNIC